MVENTKSEDCEKVMNFFTNYEQQVGHELKIPDCCDNSRKVHYITCENGYITAIVFEGHLFKDGILPSRFFDIPKLEDLEIMSSNLKSIPENINTNCPLTKLSIYNNTVEGFPNQILKFKKLKYLNLSRNEGIGTIPEGINNLENLETLYIGVTGLKSMHENIFDLKNLRDFDLDGNPDLKTRILNFGKPLDSCDLRNVNIECYQSGTCEKIIIEEEPFRKYNYDVDSSFKICTDVTRTTTNTNNSIDFDAPDENNTKLLILSSIFGSILILFSILLCYFKLKYNKNKIKNYNEDDKIKCISNYDMLNDSMVDNSSFDDFDTSKLPLNNLNSDRVTSYLSGYNVGSTTITPSEFNEKIPIQPISLSVPSLSTSFNLNLSDVNSTANLNELPFPYQGSNGLNSNNSVISNNKNLPSCIDNMSQINNISNDNDFPITLIQPLQNTYLMANHNNFIKNNNNNNNGI
ncbi:L domain-like protein [Neocallimastix californiae]|uniref:L domain-like protein n=1 Tax=Neocallimastix californiae TaxID=1754190 RepID=A0A1Y2FST2_9FUNG|nr:L domain-like protein [Neocallimastix californiae]|eukprot:ORY85775.1 L domain-like protein [Neocallimastix californiae]